MTFLPSTSWTVTSASERRFTLTFSRLFRLFHRPFRVPSTSGTPSTTRPSSLSDTPSAMHPPWVLANDEYVSQKPLGRPPFDLLASKVTPSGVVHLPSENTGLTMGLYTDPYDIIIIRF